MLHRAHNALLIKRSQTPSNALYHTGCDGDMEGEKGDEIQTWCGPGGPRQPMPAPKTEGRQPL